MLEMGAVAEDPLLTMDEDYDLPPDRNGVVIDPSIEPEVIITEDRPSHTQPLPTPSLTCAKCGYKAATHGELNAHLIAEHVPAAAPEKEQPDKQHHQCAQCPFATKYKHSLKNHAERRHSNANKEMKCGQCDFTTTNSASLKIHLKKHSGGEESIVCPRCGYRAASHGELNKHIIAEHVKIPDSVEKIADLEDGTIYRCTQCQFSTGQKSAFERHVREHVDNVACSECDFKTTDLANLKAHKKDNHRRADSAKEAGRRRSLNCDECNYTSRYPNQLREHVNAKHRMIKDKACGECDYRTSYATALNAHQKIHEKKKEEKAPPNFKPAQIKQEPRLRLCDACDFAAHDAATMQTHREMAHGLTADLANLGAHFHLRCNRCEFSAVDASVMTQHVKRVHLNIRPYHFKCPECNFSAEDSDDVVEHSKIAHSDLSAYD